ncbi:hypothetical protein LIER_30059 [Lithospermum erythrorhizon]|uniref:Uncharacterized protein n=1 Tax=Lithospermum erythrorhizon TaxID=34254 RepID=A0AAV3RRJ8_LITER
MAKGRKRGSVIGDVLQNMVDINVTEGNRLVHNQEGNGYNFVDAKNLRAQKRREMTNVPQNGSVPKKKKGRGPAQLPDQWNSRKRLDVTLNVQGQIVGGQYQEFATTIGVLAKDNTFLPEAVESIVYKMLHGCWKEWKHRVKTHYKKYGHDTEEMFEKLDDRVDLDQFREAIRYWQKPEVQLVLRGMPATQLDILSRNMGKGVNADSETADLYVSYSTI